MNSEQAKLKFTVSPDGLYRVFFDLEATCTNKNEFPSTDMEVIEIGAVLVNPKGEVVSKFQRFIRPEKHPILTDFCKELTTITQEDVDGAEIFEDVEMYFNEWAVINAPDHEKIVFISWGEFDKNILKRQSEELDVDMDYLLNNHQNGKKLFSLCLGTKRHYGVGTALKHLNMKFEGTPHRAISDAENIKRILDHVIEYKNS